LPRIDFAALTRDENMRLLAKPHAALLCEVRCFRFRNRAHDRDTAADFSAKKVAPIIA
jgi:hypothetical protein